MKLFFSWWWWIVVIATTSVSVSAYHNLILIGMPDSGKSFLGKHLATVLKIPYYDVDEIHPLLQAQKSTKQDWHRFRKTEWEIMKQLLSKKETKIISTGGGCIEYPCTYQRLLSRVQDQDIVVHIIRDNSVRAQNSPKNLPDDNRARLWEKRGKYYFMLSDTDYWNRETSTTDDFVNWWRSYASSDL